jgi:hypothetical protein
LQAVAAKAHARNGGTGAMAYGFNRWAWARATFAVGGQPWTADIDALAVRRGKGKCSHRSFQREVSASQPQP